ncbi:hypothetical protein ACP70R_042021 [Stipagrostis hirtigluma subsp. patula]
MTLQLGETVEGRWKDLPDDMCYLILDHLDHISVLSFSVTCKPWAKVCSSIPVFKSGMATLITSRPDVDGSRIEYDMHDGLFGLNVVSTQASVVCQSHALENRFWVGGKNDWVVLCDDLLNVELFNPITNTRVPLPSFSTIPDASIDPYFSSSLQYAPFSRLIERIALCQTPRHPDGYLAVAQFSEGFLAFTSASNFSWVALKNPTDVDGMVNYCPEHFLDAIVHMNNVLAVNMYGEIYSWDMRSPSVHPTRMMAPTQVPHPGFLFRGVYLAISLANESIYYITGYIILQVMSLWASEQQRPICIDGRTLRRNLLIDMLAYEGNSRIFAVPENVRQYLKRIKEHAI